MDLVIKYVYGLPDNRPIIHATHITATHMLFTRVSFSRFSEKCCHSRTRNITACTLYTTKIWQTKTMNTNSNECRTTMTQAAWSRSTGCKLFTYIFLYLFTNHIVPFLYASTYMLYYNLAHLLLGSPCEKKITSRKPVGPPCTTNSSSKSHITLVD